MANNSEKKFSLNVQGNIFFGLFILVPLWLSIYVAYYIFIILARLTYPLVAELPISGNQYVMYFLSFTLTLVILYLIGVMAKMWFGRMILAGIDHTVQNIPIIGSFYKALKQLVDSFNSQDKSSQKVVLINFPSEEMKTIGFIIKTFHDASSNQMLATVYVPTTPNPTSGYLEIVPVDKTIALDWTFEEAMTFIISGGSSMPNKAINFR